MTDKARFLTGDQAGRFEQKEKEAVAHYYTERRQANDNAWAEHHRHMCAIHTGIATELPLKRVGSEYIGRPEAEREDYPLRQPQQEQQEGRRKAWLEWILPSSPEPLVRLVGHYKVEGGG